MLAWDRVAKIINENDRFVVSTHIHPEGDAIGAEVALASFLEDLGKRATIVNSSPTPANCAFLDPEARIRVYPDDYDPSVLEDCDVVVIVDVGNWEHLGPFREAVKRSSKVRICIDHHQDADEGFADPLVLDTRAAAAGLLIYELIKHMNGKITPRIAEAVYAAIITDTGTFRFTNTDERVFRAAMELTHSGIEPFKLHRQMFSKTPAAVKLLGPVISTLDMTPDGRLAWIYATQSMLRDIGAEYEDSDGLIDVVRSMKDLEFCLFFKELADGRVKVSLRSNGNVDVFEIARRFGGGGHRMASGLSIDGPLELAIEKVVTVCAEEYLPKD